MISEDEQRPDSSELIENRVEEFLPCKIFTDLVLRLCCLLLFAIVCSSLLSIGRFDGRTHTQACV